MCFDRQTKKEGAPAGGGGHREKTDKIYKKKRKESKERAI